MRSTRDGPGQEAFSDGASIVTDKPDPTLRRKSMPPPVSYEVQVFGGGKWTTELVLTDRQEAEDEALRTLDSSRRPLGVRVVREEVDEKTSLITATTVFRRTREDDRSADEKEDKRQQMKGPSLPRSASNVVRRRGLNRLPPRQPGRQNRGGAAPGLSLDLADHPVHRPDHRRFGDAAEASLVVSGVAPPSTARIRAMVRVVLWPCSSGTSATRPPCACTKSAPTT